MLLEELFAKVLRLSFYGSIGCGVILVCVLINYMRVPRWISMVLWGLVALRLVMPLSVSSAVSFLQIGNVSDFPDQLIQTLSADETYIGDYKTAIEGSRDYDRAVAAGSPVAANADGDRMAYYYERANGGIEPARTTYDRFLTIGSRVWITGMSLLWLWALLSCLRLKYRLRFSMRLSKNVYETDAVSSPCVIGIIRPRIYLIPELTEQQKAHILLHEKMHIRYLDPVWKMVSFVVISIHWFNPFLWFMYTIFQGELEKVCDERVIAWLGEDKKADYSESLLALSASKNWRKKWNLPTPISFGENNIKGRIRQILAYRKPLVTASVLIVILAAAGCSIFLTTPTVSSANTPKTNSTAAANPNPHQEGTTQPTDTPDAEPTFLQKNILQLSQSEQQQFGRGITQSILAAPGTLVNISNQVRGQNMSYLDMDGDGTAEKITLAPSSSPDAALYQSDDDPLGYYHLQIGSAELERVGYNVENILWALSLDGQNILLVLYEDGPSADPYTHFFQYAHGQIQEIGGFDADIRLCEISADGIITGTILKEIVQTDWITVQWRIDQDGMLEQIPQDVYDFKSVNWVALHEKLPLHTAAGSDKTFVIAPQNVRFLQTSADWNWILLETESGQRGWIHLDNFNVVELQKNVMDVFDGLYMAG